MTDQQLKILVGQSIARERKIKKFSQAQVAEYLKIETETVSRLETGAIAPTLKRLAQLSEMFDCPVSSFFQRANVNLSSQAQAIADMLEPLTKDERQLVFDIVDKMTMLVKSRKN